MNCVEGLIRLFNVIAKLACYGYAWYYSFVIHDYPHALIFMVWILVIRGNEL